MKISDVKECMEMLKKDMGDSLIMSTLVGIEDGQAIYSINSNGKMDAITAQMTSFLISVVENSPSKKIEEFFFLELDGTVAGVFIVIDKYVWGTAFDQSKTPMGMVLNVYLPDCTAKFKALI